MWLKIFTSYKLKQVKLTLQQAMKACKVLRRRRAYIFCTIGLEMAKSLSVLRAGRAELRSPQEGSGIHIY
jgi:hypothetical protein